MSSKTLLIRSRFTCSRLIKLNANKVKKDKGTIMDLETSKNINTRYLYMLLYLRATNVEYCLDNLSDFVTIFGNLKFFSNTWVTVLKRDGKLITF